jgi:hypothetical protein
MPGLELGPQSAPRSSVDTRPADSRPAVVKGPDIPRDKRSVHKLIRQDVQFESFPESWNPKSKIRFERIGDAEFQQTAEILTRCIAKYPESSLESSMDAIYVMKSLQFDGKEIMGCVARRTIYFCNSGDVMVFTDAFIERALHYYIASALFDSHPDWFESSAWKRSLPVVFKYLLSNSTNLEYQERGWGTSGESSHNHPPGTVVASGSFESEKFEFAQIASALYCNRPDLWAAVKRKPRLAKKADVVMAFYANLHASLTRQYFQRLPQIPFVK